MDGYEKALEVMNELFGKDCVFALATAQKDKPSVRFVDTFYLDGSFFVVTHAKTQKVQDLEGSSHVALTNQFHRFTGKGRNIGHPLRPENQQIRKTLITVFEPWYFPHNDENDKDMCYVEIELIDGFFHKDGMGYSVNFLEGTAEIFPFERD
ncbi:MAG TPA: pyridoxamine 5'-phosphate oxidase family protein [Firmicutes bacterium]|nr:pyridoxamine 5'-phosphate oxidase family protein [Bacillota bacterium]